MKVLIVDDELDISEFISYNLKKEDYEVFIANNGSQALNIIYVYNQKSTFTFSVKNLMDQKREMVTRSYSIDDQVYSSYRPGMTFGFKWSYSFY